MKKPFLLLLSTGMLLGGGVGAQTALPAGREHLLMDFDWRFAYGHPFDPAKDFDHGLGYFSYFAKTGYGDGAAALGFDDRSWRQLNLPHDWAVEQGFSEKASFSHGFKTIGRPFPESSVGWYRKTFRVPAADLGRRLSLQFDGVFRNSSVWINGHLLGNEPSGYYGFNYDISDYLNYDGDNVVAVRADVTMEEGWFYEGAGIYRHVWLNKTAPLHVAANGTFVTTAPAGAGATITARATVVNDGPTPQTAEVVQEIVDASGKTVATSPAQTVRLATVGKQELTTTIALPQARLWSLEDPYRYRLLTHVRQDGQEADRYETMFGVRTIRFDANQGFFLNGKHVELKGANNHQDHAGVGVAMPDALQEFRIATMKAYGMNAYRCSHNPPTPELLDACDRLGMLVLDEVRLLGSSEMQVDYARRLIERDRNHPSVIVWSMGNEEWAVEGNIMGARLAAGAQRHAKALDSTRAITTAISGGWGNGISTTIDVMGYNYISQGNTDTQHAKFPNQPSIGTEEGSTWATRGIYFPQPGQQYAAAYDQKGAGSSLEQGRQHYAARPYLSGMFVWTGFDYRGEPNPFKWPANLSSFGMLDLCGFPKDDAFYLRAWWSDKPSLHLLPHWNWAGRENQPIEVWAYGNCDEVELLLNHKSLGRKPMPRNSHIAWTVPYAPGTLEAIGYTGGKKILADVVKTAGPAATLRLTADKTTVRADHEDISVVTVRVQDKGQVLMPIADNDITFQLTGPGKIIGVGNGNPTSLEADKFIETVQRIPFAKLEEKPVESLAPDANLTASTDKWSPAYSTRPPDVMPTAPLAKAYAYRSSFDMPVLVPGATVTFYYRSIGPEQSIYLNGKPLAQSIAASKKGDTFVLDAKTLKTGRNDLLIVATPFVKQHTWDVYNTNPGLVQIVTPAAVWHRRAFNGLAQVIVQSTQAAGPLALTATAPGLKPATLKINATATALRPSVP
jgi:beta-galactosidase